MTHREKARPFGQPQVTEELTSEEKAALDQKAAQWEQKKGDFLSKEVNALCATAQNTLLPDHVKSYFYSRQAYYESKTDAEIASLPEAEQEEHRNMKITAQKVAANEAHRQALLRSIENGEPVDVKAGWSL